MDDDIAALLRRERLAEPFPPTGARERSFEAVMAKVAAAEALATEASSPPPPTPPALSAEGTSRGLLVVGALLVGAVLGALAMTLVPRPVPAEPAAIHEVAYVPAYVPVGYPVSTPNDLTFEDLPKAKVAAPQPSPSGPQSGDRLTAERNLLDAARVSLASGEANEAVRLAERHRRDFPAGALVEEREAIATKALVEAHRYDEAKSRGAAFEKRFPQSAMLRSVRSSLATISATP